MMRLVEAKIVRSMAVPGRAVDGPARDRVGLDP